LNGYNIRSISKASGNAIGGGSNVYATYNRKYEEITISTNSLSNDYWNQT
jgi:hypothetical protein